jgi:hypothetical protein
MGVLEEITLEPGVELVPLLGRTLLPGLVLEATLVSEVERLGEELKRADPQPLSAPRPRNAAKMGRRNRRLLIV